MFQTQSEYRNPFPLLSFLLTGAPPLVMSSVIASPFDPEDRGYYNRFFFVSRHVEVTVFFYLSFSKMFITEKKLGVITASLGMQVCLKSLKKIIGYLLKQAITGLRQSACDTERNWNIRRVSARSVRKGLL